MITTMAHPIYGCFYPGDIATLPDSYGQILIDAGDATQVGPADATVPTQSPDVHFKGYAAGPPIAGTYVLLDYFLNLFPQLGAPDGWVNVAGGNPGAWSARGALANPHDRGYAAGPPTTGTYAALDFIHNIAPAIGAPEGWITLLGGSPGVWLTKGIIGSTDGS